MPEANKTEKPTPRRRQKAREQGQVARSRDLVASLGTLTVIMILAAQAPGFVCQWRGFLRESIERSSHGDLRLDSPLLILAGQAVLRATAVGLGMSWVVALLGGMAQGGIVFSPSALQPQLARISPATRLQQLFSLPALGRLVKSLLPGAVVIYLAIAMLSRDWLAVLALLHRSGAELSRFTAERCYEIAWKSGLVLLLWSGADYLLERGRLEGELRMSRQDLADELKETEGHPTVKARIRRLQRQVRRKRMLEQVKRASVVITNPTEFAVALEYRPEMPAPVVVAKGRNLIAKQIKDLARWHGIPLVENPPLAHALYRAVEVGQSIPPKLYTVVAGILAALYRAQQRAGHQAAKIPRGGR